MFIVTFLMVGYGLWTVFIMAAIYQAFIRPYRSMLFFSYSHKDTAVAERILGSLNRFHFKTWVDFGKMIPQEELETELGAAVNSCDIAILLASANSSSSQWVAFEVRQAIGLGRKGFRDFVVLALDDSGMRVPQYLSQLDRATGVDKEMEAAKALGAAVGETLVGRITGSVLRSEGRYDRTFGRLGGREVVVFDFRRAFEAPILDVTEHLKRITKIKWSGCLTVWRIFMIGIWALVTIVLMPVLIRVFR